MNDQSLFGDVCSTIRLLNGVTIVETSVSIDSFRIDFTVMGSLSRLILVHVAEASNIRLDLWCHYDPASKQAIEDADAALHYRFSFQGKDVVDSLKWLGAQLVWQLHSCNIIDADKEKILCGKFNARSRSA